MRKILKLFTRKLHPEDLVFMFGFAVNFVKVITEARAKLITPILVNGRNKGDGARSG